MGQISALQVVKAAIIKVKISLSVIFAIFHAVFAMKILIIVQVVI